MKKVYLALVAMMFAITSFGKSLSPDFTTGKGGSITWDSATETITWNAGWDNWINMYNFGASGELKDYQTLKFSISDLTGMYRIILKGASDANLATFDNQSATGDITIVFAENNDFKNVDLSAVERILIAGRGDSGSLVLKNVSLEGEENATPEPEPAPVPDIIEFDIDKSMFKGWDKADETAVITNENPWWDGGLGVEKENGAVLFGNGSVNWNEYADLTGYEKLIIYGKGDNVRVMFNRAEHPENKGALTEIQVKPTPEGTEINLAEKFATSAFVHLNCIKIGWGLKATVTRIVLTKKDVQPLKDIVMEDIPFTSPSKTFSTSIKGAATLKVNPAEDVKKIAKITKFDGTPVTTATILINSAGKVAMTTEEVLANGDYCVTIAENVFNINDQIYDKPLKCILAVGEKDEAALNAYENDFANEIETASYIKESLIYGVNLFQYAPGLKKKIQAEMDEAEYYAELLVEEEHIYNVIAKLRMYIKSLRPILPQTDKEYRIKHKPTGLYLNISGENVILSKDATPVQFHLTEPSEGPWCWMNNHWNYGYFDEVYYTSHAAYIYTTPERKYLGYNIEEKEVGEGNDKYTYKAPVSTNKKNTVWYIDVNHTNNYEIYIAYDYNNNGGYYDWLYAPSDAEEGADVTCDDKMIGYGDDELVEITPIIDNGNIVITPNNPLPGQVVKPIEDQIPGYMWFIEDNDAPSADIKPETPEEPEEPVGPEPEPEDDGMTEIAQDQGKTLDDFTRAELVEGEEYNTYTVNGDLQIAIKMVNIDVAGCDYVVIKFAEPVAAGWKLAFWGNQDLTDIPAGATEFKYVFADDAKCGVKDGVLPQICMMTFFGGYEAPLVAKVTGIWKHTAATGDNSSSEEVTSISSVEAAANATAIYNAAGARTNTLQKGINIVKMANGKVVKIMK